jgi:hypothetical protein
MPRRKPPVDETRREHGLRSSSVLLQRAVCNKAQSSSVPRLMIYWIVDLRRRFRRCQTWNMR